MTSRSGGFSKARLARMRDVMAGHVERGTMPGLVTLVSRRGEAHVETLGTHGADGGRPMRRDTIFRIASMTKPVAAAAAMILVEECRLRLDEPVDRLLPELADRRVLRRLDGPLDDTVPAQPADHPARSADLPPGLRRRSWRRRTRTRSRRRCASADCAWGHPSRRRRPRPTSGCAASARCR